MMPMARDKRGRFLPLKPNLYPSEALGYVLGVMRGDGWVSTDKVKYGTGYTLALETIDPEFAKEFYTKLVAIGLHPYSWTSWRHCKPEYNTRARSKIYYQWLMEVELSDLLPITEHMRLGFIRGFFDSEGSVAFLVNGQTQIGMSNRNKELLSLVRQLLRGFNIHSTIAKNGHSKWCLLIATVSHSKFAGTIGSRIKRKQERLEYLIERGLI